MFAHIKDDSELLKTAVRLQYIKETGATPILEESEIELAGEIYVSAMMYSEETDAHYSAFVRLLDDTVITISLRYDDVLRDKAEAFLASISLRGDASSARTI